ncbi:MAG: hypothetical protein GY941_16535, partial [Planctomycetes bacterium]|nr:hypothetical protein [Planctomycetota bacterium]
MKRRNLLKSLFIAPVIPLLPNNIDPVKSEGGYPDTLDIQEYGFSQSINPTYPGIHSPHGKLHIYERGTTIPATVFCDPEMTIPYGNPIIANSQGVYDEIF